MAAKSGGCGSRIAAILLLCGLAGIGIYSCDKNRQAGRFVEQQRRDALTPEQRTAEDKTAAETKAAEEKGARTERLKIEAGEACEGYVRDSLKFPDDASFPWLGCDVTANSEGDVFACEGKVTAKNGFGAALTYRFAAIVYLDGDTWRLVHLTINGATVADRPELVAAIKAKHSGDGTSNTEQASRANHSEKKPPRPKAEYRTWTDASGEHKIDAKYSGMVLQVVKLIRRDGTVVKVPLEKLSEEDRQWIQKLFN